MKKMSSLGGFCSIRPINRLKVGPCCRYPVLSSPLVNPEGLGSFGILSQRRFQRHTGPRMAPRAPGKSNSAPGLYLGPFLCPLAKGVIRVPSRKAGELETESILGIHTLRQWVGVTHTRPPIPRSPPRTPHESQGPSEPTGAQ